MVLATLPPSCAPQVELTAGSVLLEEDQLLAVSARHRFARRSSVSFSDVARTTILRTPPAISDDWDQALIPQRTPDGRPVERGPTFETSQEMLALVGAGVGSYTVSAQFTSYYARPDVAYVPIHDAPPYQRRLLWCSAAETTTIRAFDRVAVAAARAHTS